MNQLKSRYNKIRTDAKAYATSKNVPLPTIFLPIQYILISTGFIFSFTVTGFLAFVLSFEPVDLLLLKILEVYTYVSMPLIAFSLFFGIGKYFYYLVILKIYLFNKIIMYVLNKLNLHSWKKNKTDHPIMDWLLRIQSYVQKNKARSKLIIIFIIVALSVSVNYDTYVYAADKIIELISSNIENTISGDIQFISYASALSRTDIDIIKSEIRTAKLKLDGMDKKISEQYVVISNNEATLEQKKDDLRRLKSVSNESWSAVQSIDTSQAAVSSAEKTVKDAKEKLRELLIEKSDYIKQIKSLEIELKDTELELRVQSKPDISGLVKRIAVQNSKICETMLINHINTTCPSYRVLRSLDSSNTGVSGKFQVHPSTGFYHRVEPLNVNSIRYYDNDQQLRLFVNPPSDYLTRMPTITIYPNFDTYKVSGGMVETIPIQYSNHTVTKTYRNGTEYTVDFTKAYQLPQQVTGETGIILYHHVYVDPKCKEAKINADRWKELLPIIIDYMRNNCDDKRLLIDFKEIIPANFTQHDITTSQKYKDEQRLSHIKEFCIYKYKACVDDDKTKMIMQNEK